MLRAFHHMPKTLKDEESHEENNPKQGEEREPKNKENNILEQVVFELCRPKDTPFQLK